MITLTNLRQTGVSDILQDLPDIKPLEVTHYATGISDELFIAALGFEDRCPWISGLMAEHREYRANEAIYLEYSTNKTDNELNKLKLVGAMESFASQVRPMACDSENFPSQMRTLLKEITARSNSPGVTFDISTCSSKVLVTCLTMLLEFDVKLRVVYSEANLYHPTKVEYEADPGKWTMDEGLGVARGVSAVTPSPDHPGSRRDNLPEAVIAFPTFKPERTRAIIAHVDPSLLMSPEQRVIWLVGQPHLAEDHWRADIQRSINEIPTLAPAYEVSTFDYKNALERLDYVYQPLECRYHVNIAPLGSKMQCIGVVLFWYIRAEVSIIFASPREYNAVQYSEGCKAIWYIDFGPLDTLRNLLDRVGQIQIIS